MSTRSTEFHAKSGPIGLSIQIEADGGSVHLQRRVARVDKQGGEDVEQDFLFRREDEFEQWWAQDPHRFEFAQVMEEVRKWVLNNLRV